MSRNVGGGSVKVLLEGEAASGVPLRVKIEVNTDEVPPALALTRIAHRVEPVGGRAKPKYRPSSPPSSWGRSSGRLRSGEKGGTCGTCGSPAGNSGSPTPI